MRDAVIIGIACVVAIALGAWLYFGTPVPTPSAAATQASTNSVPSTQTVSGTPAVFSVIAEGQIAPSFATRANYRIGNASDLKALWNMLYPQGGAALPTVDWSRNEVLAVFDGTHPTGGYAVTVSAVSDGGTRMVAITHTVPGKGCLTNDIVTSPFQIISLPKTTLGLSHTDRALSKDCK